MKEIKIEEPELHDSHNDEDLATLKQKHTFFRLDFEEEPEEESISSEEVSWEISESTSIDLSKTEDETGKTDSDDNDLKDSDSLWDSKISSLTSVKAGDLSESSMVEPDTTTSIFASIRGTNSRLKPAWKTLKSTYGVVAEPTESELAENTWGFGEPFADYMTRLYTIADHGLGQFNSGVADVDTDEEVLTTDSEDNFWSYDRDCCTGWEALSRYTDPWCETRYPVPQLLSRNELSEEELNSPELSIDKIACSISNLTVPPGFSQYACTKLQLENMGIQSVKPLIEYRFLQYIDLMSNKIEDLNPLWEIPHLVVLDVSHNLINEAGFGHPSGPHFLTYLNVSHNRLRKVPDVTDCWALKHLNLSHNSISKIENLENLNYLEYLNISFNYLEIADNLFVEQLSELDLSHNKLHEWNQAQNQKLKKLETLNISNNNLFTLRALKEINCLQSLDISYNNVYHLNEFSYLESFSSLRILALIGNPLDSSITDSRKLLVYKLSKLEVLNGAPVLQKERGQAIMHYSLEDFHESMCRDGNLFFKNHYFTPFLQFEKPKAVIHPAIVVFVGLLGSHRAEILFELQKLNPRKVRVSEFYSARPKHKHPPNWPIAAAQALQIYVQDKKFYKLQGAGTFVATYSEFGYPFGIPCSEMEYTNVVLLVMANLSAALSLVSKGFNPTLLLILPTCEEDFKEKIVGWLNRTQAYKSDAHTRLVEEKLSSGRRTFRRKTEAFSQFYKERKSLKNHECRQTSSLSGPKLSKPRKKMSSKRCSAPRFLKISQADQKKLNLEAEQERFMSNMLKMREHYLDEHKQKPGLFRLFIPSDNVEYAVQKSNEIIQESYKRLLDWKNKSARTIPFSDDPLFEEMVMPVARQYADELLAGCGPSEML